MAKRVQVRIGLLEYPQTIRIEMIEMVETLSA